MKASFPGWRDRVVVLMITPPVTREVFSTTNGFEICSGCNHWTSKSATDHCTCCAQGHQQS